MQTMARHNAPMTPTPATAAESSLSLAALTDQCVMCGLCLPHCPTFRLGGIESRSPRGRIALARQLADGAVAVDFSAWGEALETCLQCRACESVCPAKVEYGQIIETARAQLHRVQGPGLLLRWCSAAVQRPALLARTMGMAGRLARRLGTGRGSRWLRYLQRARAAVKSSGKTSAVANAESGLFLGCVARSFEADAHRAMLSVARRIGAPLVPLTAAGCCGAFARHLGDRRSALRCEQHNRATIAALSLRQVVAMDSACITALRAGTPESVAVVEACRWLLDRKHLWQPLLASVPVRRRRIGYFAPCTHRHMPPSVSAVNALLADLGGMDLVPVSAALGCCGAAGPHLLAHPDQADALAESLVEHIVSLELDTLLTTNVGCAMHLEERLKARGISLELQHPVQIVLQRLATESDQEHP